MVDRTYLRDAAPDAPVLIDDPVLGRTIEVVNDGAPQAVVWNPGQAADDAMGDLATGEWRGFVCVEAVARLDRSIVLAPGKRVRSRRRSPSAERGHPAYRDDRPDSWRSRPPSVDDGADDTIIARSPNSENPCMNVSRGTRCALSSNGSLMRKESSSYPTMSTQCRLW